MSAEPEKRKREGGRGERAYGGAEGPGCWPPEVAQILMNTQLTVKGSRTASSNSSTSGSHFSDHTSLL